MVSDKRPVRGPLLRTPALRSRHVAAQFIEREAARQARACANTTKQMIDSRHGQVVLWERSVRGVSSPGPSLSSCALPSLPAPVFFSNCPCYPCPPYYSPSQLSSVLIITSPPGSNTNYPYDPVFSIGCPSCLSPYYLLPRLPLSPGVCADGVHGGLSV